MPTVNERFRLSSTDADRVFANLPAIDKYTDFAPSVLSVEIDDAADVSSWEVEFRGGTMRWRERDEYEPSSRTYRFWQLTGDLKSFSGEWRVVEGSEGVRLDLRVNFDLGMPSLAELVDPVAERALLENLRAVADGVDQMSLASDAAK